MVRTFSISASSFQKISTERTIASKEDRFLETGGLHLICQDASILGVTPEIDQFRRLRCNRGQYRRIVCFFRSDAHKFDHFPAKSFKFNLYDLCQSFAIILTIMHYRDLPETQYIIDVRSSSFSLGSISERYPIKHSGTFLGKSWIGG